MNPRNIKAAATHLSVNLGAERDPITNEKD
jgi:hypothetical protein